ncbi:hypothetical protein PBY51_016921 [Eleginops maclovinus]|uniref:Uncharacterized protein n=1 Tax=Eleginops maclovinus TaxID=56733 RepID=A0AAN7WRD2_ELEMC|nr:hypothetical protein PBY51_016921 [Eleginops maclovinus]
MFLQLHNHKLSPWERLESWIGRDKEWVREKEKVERGKVTERATEAGRDRERGSLETQRRPQRPNKRRSGRQQPALPSPPPSLPTVQR